MKTYTNLDEFYADYPEPYQESEEVQTQEVVLLKAALHQSNARGGASMTRIQMGSDSTLIAVASIPPRIWEQDKATWKAWLATLTKASVSTKQTYKRYIAEFCWECEKTILQITEQNLLDYHASLCAHGSTSTANTRIRTIRAYWKFAQQQAQEATK